MTAERTTLAEFIQTAGVTLTAEWADRNPHMDDSATMDHWKCKLRAGGRCLTVYFSKGIGHHGAEPTADEVLDCLASDSASIANTGGFKEWCAEFGYDTDSRKAHRTYKTCERQADKLCALLGPAAYGSLLFDVERL